jgi:hypothetical protein
MADFITKGIGDSIFLKTGTKDFQAVKDLLDIIQKLDPAYEENDQVIRPKTDQETARNLNALINDRASHLRDALEHQMEPTPIALWIQKKQHLLPMTDQSN